MPDASFSNTPTVSSDSYPTALVWPISFERTNAPLPLYAGPIEYKQKDTTFRAESCISLEWFPSPRVRFDIPAVPDDVYPDLSSLTLRLDDGTEIEQAVVTGSQHTCDETGYSSNMSGVIAQRVIRPRDAFVSSALFLLPNFDAPLGRGLLYPDRSERAARLVLAGAGWLVTLDEVANAKDVKSTLSANSGFAITQIGRLEREDGKPFTAKDAIAILDAVAWYVSFACGRWAGPCFMKGFDPKHAQVWEVWDYRRVVPFRKRRSWMDSIHLDHIESPFSGFFKLWQDDTWEEVVRQAIHWYIEANGQAGSVEGSIVLTQTAFELLASAILVENYAWLSTDGYEKLAAADRIRLLFLWSGIPTTIPAELKDLTRAAKADNWPDTPTAMTMVRNTITHPTRKNREKFGKQPKGVRADVWSLGLLYLELCLLRLFEYRGTYASRITQKHAGEVVPVPWAAHSPK